MRIDIRLGAPDTPDLWASSVAHNTIARLPPQLSGRPRGGVVEIKEAQRLAWQNKIDKGFNTSDVPLEFMLLQGEVAESFRAWRRAQPDLGEELADVALYVFALAEMNGVDLDSEIEQKIAKNARRRYLPDSNGVPIRIEGTPMRVARDPSRRTNTSIDLQQDDLELEGSGAAADRSATAQDHTAKVPARTHSLAAAAVAEFHAAFDLPRQALPCVDISEDLAQLRVALLEEEVNEFVAATHARDLVGIADALADIVYVAYGAAVTYGIDLDLVLAEVHRANMSKLDTRGQPVKRADGKVMKSDRYRPPDVHGVLQLQSPLFWPNASCAG